MNGLANALNGPPVLFSPRYVLSPREVNEVLKLTCDFRDSPQNGYIRPNQEELSIYGPEIWILYGPAYVQCHRRASVLLKLTCFTDYQMDI